MIASIKYLHQYLNSIAKIIIKTIYLFRKAHCKMENNIDQILNVPRIFLEFPFILLVNVGFLLRLRSYANIR